MIVGMLALGLIGRSFSVVLGGDLMLNGIPTARRPLAKLASITKPAGVALANLEIPLTDARSPTLRKSLAEVQRRDQFILKADPGHASAIATCGFDLVSLANNHCMDYRAQGLADMTASLERLGVLFAGAGPNRDAAFGPAIFTAPDGRRVGLISALAFMGSGALGKCTPAGKASAGVATFAFGGRIGSAAKAELKARISAAKKICDLLIVALHWGIERQTLPTPYQVALGRACVDAGADVVWGHHPHVLQGAELYRGRPILYSMGNLISPKEGATGIVNLVYDARGYRSALFLPLEISGGRVSPVNGARGQTRATAFKLLCRTLAKRYPSKFAQSLL